jgi:hypothetical protein
MRDLNRAITTTAWNIFITHRDFATTKEEAGAFLMFITVSVDPNLLRAEILDKRWLFNFRRKN